MFVNTSFFILLKRRNDFEIRRLLLERETQLVLCDLFSQKAGDIISGDNEYVNFNGDYRAAENEIHTISDYDINADFVDAIRNPDSIIEFSVDDLNDYDIKGIFTGSELPEIIIAFQSFNLSQLISRKGISIFQRQDVFEEVRAFGLSVLEKVDCVYKDQNLYFSSFYNVRGLFDLSSYYRIATDDELIDFREQRCMHIENFDYFKEISDQPIRRMIARILDSGVLTNTPARTIIQEARQYQIDIPIVSDGENDMISLPEDRKQIKRILKVIDEDLFTGPFTNRQFETNSKHSIT